MKTKTLDSFFKVGEKEESEGIEEKKLEKKTSSAANYEASKIKKLLELREPTENLDAKNAVLLSVEYDSEKNKALMKFYDPEKKIIIHLYDKTGHHPYFLTNVDEDTINQIKARFGERVLGIEIIKKYHPLYDKIVELKKIIVRDPLAVGGRGGIREYVGEGNAWEAWIPYHLNYIYDNDLQPCMPHQIEQGIPKPKKIKIDETKGELLSSIDDWLKPLAEEYLPLLTTPIDKIDFLAIDIEVAGGGRIPQTDKPIYPIIAVSFSGIQNQDGNARKTNFIFLLERKDIVNDLPIKAKNDVYDEGEINVNGEKVSFRIYKNEKTMLLDLFEIMYQVPIIVTFNGDNFDLRYISKRAKHLNIPNEAIPIKLSSKGALKEANVRYGLHIDLYKFFSNAAIKVYAFSNKYETVSLDAISDALLKERKITVRKEEIETLTLKKLAEYCWWDAHLTAELFTLNNWLPFRLIALLSRITKMPPFELTRRGVSSWIENWFYYEHRKRNYLIPNRRELLEKDHIFTQGRPRLPPVIKGKGYRGAIVLTPKQGIWFNVWVLDFASIYPTIIKVHNISYETLCCVHPECKDNLIMLDPSDQKKASYWVCKRKKGITSELIGLIRDMRVKYFKTKAKETSGGEKEFYQTVSGALKVLINASYGVFGAEHFPLYSIMVAETITGLGRVKIHKIVEEAQKRGLNVIYGDTDSIFISNPEENQVRDLIKWSEKYLKVDLDVDKIYRYVAFSARKKNYFGILSDGTPDVKGLLGKKRNTPEFLKREFREAINILRNAKSEDEMRKAIEILTQKITNIFENIQKRRYDLPDLAFKVQLTKPISAYTKTTPQHVKAAKKLKRKVMPGEIIAYVKTKSGVEPLENLLNKRGDWKKDIDWAKYEEYTKSVFDQLLDALGLEIEKIISKSKGVTDITSFF
ncbi:MAG: DNA-directed DNA polymerase I [Candidatus Njordarchaeia archaeon]